ncbi:MAG TPA: adenylate/guanylate cyclase domain-containing protein [Rectinemataceae bacterium]|nr:adenylate/guanylate cyclase domain-containing protein [Rectinemataceae bacterium]
MVISKSTARIAFLSTLILLASAAVASGPQVSSPPEPTSPVVASVSPATAGYLDLGSWRGEGVVELSGGWNLQWGGDPPGKTRTIKVPSRLSSATGTDFGWGVYRLDIDLPEGIDRDLEGGLGIYLPPIDTSCLVLWNGKLLWKSGIVSPDPKTAQPHRLAAVLPLVPRAGMNRLEISVANYADMVGGLTVAPAIGSLRALLDRRSATRLRDVFLFGSLLAMGLYNLGLFAFRPSDRASLWFSLLSLLLALRQIGLDDSLIFSSFPTLSWELEMKVSYITFSGPILCFAFFLLSLFREYAPRWFRPIIVAGAGLYSVAVLIFPARVYSRLLFALEGYAAILGLVAILILVRALRGKAPGSGLFLAGFLPLFATMIHDILKTNLFLPTPYLAPAGLLAFIIFQSLTLMRKITEALSVSQEHGRYMQEMNVALERFIPREILSFLGKDSIMEIKLGDHSERSMTVLFADIRDFTTLSERLTPDENFRFINSYLERMGPLIRRHGGFVDKYIGDGIMALFPDDPSDAIDAALEIRAALLIYNVDRAKFGYAPIRVGIGLHWGPLMLGTIGENRRMDSTVISDTVNTASRLEGLTKKYARDILVSGETVEAAEKAGKGGHSFELLGEELVKGRSKPVAVHAI